MTTKVRTRQNSLSSLFDNGEVDEDGNIRPIHRVKEEVKIFCIKRGDYLIAKTQEMIARSRNFRIFLNGEYIDHEYISQNISGTDFYFLESDELTFIPSAHKISHYIGPNRQHITKEDYKRDYQNIGRSIGLSDYSVEQFAEYVKARDEANSIVPVYFRYEHSKVKTIITGEMCFSSSEFIHTSVSSYSLLRSHANVFRSSPFPSNVLAPYYTISPLVIFFDEVRKFKDFNLSIALSKSRKSCVNFSIPRIFGENKRENRFNTRLGLRDVHDNIRLNDQVIFDKDTSRELRMGYETRDMVCFLTLKEAEDEEKSIRQSTWMYIFSCLRKMNLLTEDFKEALLGDQYDGSLTQEEKIEVLSEAEYQESDLDKMIAKRDDILNHFNKLNDAIANRQAKLMSSK